ncbi:hypothetical protein [Streptomyces antimycoticus]
MGVHQFSSDPLHRISEYQTAAVNAQIQVHAILAAAGLSAENADELMCAIEAGAVAGAQCQVVEWDGSAPSERGEAYGEGWYDGVTTVCNQLVRAADFLYQQRGGAASTLKLIAYQAQRQATQQAAAEERAEEGSEASEELIGQTLAVCEEHYAAVTGTCSAQWDKELSRELVGVALRTVRLAEREAYPQRLEEYLRGNHERLKQLWRRYGPDGLYPRGVYHLVELPESFVLCERIDNAPLWLQGVWEEEGHEETPLERLKKSWLYGTGDKDGR